MSYYGISDTLADRVETAERFAAEHFDGDDWFVGITKWQDGDFLIQVRRGIDRQDHPDRQRYELISYRHEDGQFVYTKATRYVDHRFEEYDERKVLD